MDVSRPLTMTFDQGHLQDTQSTRYFIQTGRGAAKTGSEPPDSGRICQSAEPGADRGVPFRAIDSV